MVQHPNPMFRHFITGTEAEANRRLVCIHAVPESGMYMRRIAASHFIIKELADG